MYPETQRRPAVEVPAERQDQNTIRVQTTTDAPSCQALLLDCLYPGAENAIPSKDLLTMIGLTNTRELRRVVADARRAGAVILSDRSGYYLPSDGEQGQQEAADFLRMIEAKAAATFQAGDSARRFLRAVIPGQTTVTTGTENGGGD